MQNIYIKKIWSLTPFKYKYITLDNALDMYHEYITQHKTTDDIKTFKNWCLTEI